MRKDRLEGGLVSLNRGETCPGVLQGGAVTHGVQVGIAVGQVPAHRIQDGELERLPRQRSVTLAGLSTRHTNQDQHEDDHETYAPALRRDHPRCLLSHA